jgi:hypothetical protein
VGLTALVDNRQGGPLLDRQLIGFEVPARIGSSAVRLVDQLLERGLETKTETIQRDVVAEARPFLPSAGLNVVGSHSSRATTWATVGERAPPSS